VILLSPFDAAFAAFLSFDIKLLLSLLQLLLFSLSAIFFQGTWTAEIGFSGEEADGGQIDERY
jgi:hypothetical protein